MSLTVKQVALDAFSFFGFTQGVVPANVPDLTARIRNDIQATRKTLFLRNGVNNIIKTDVGFVLRGPVTVGVTATNKAQTLTGTTALDPLYMDGCTCLLDGAPEQNRLQYLGSNVWQLRYPFRGPTGACNITVWNDCVKIDPLAISIERPVGLPGYSELTPLLNEGDVFASSFAYGWNYGGFTDSGRLGYAMEPGGYPSLMSNRQAATPLNYLTEFNLDPFGFPLLYIRLDPMTDAEYLLTYWQRKLPQDIIGLTDTTAQLVPMGMDEACFLPLVRERISGHPGFTGNRALMKEDAAAARLTLEDVARSTALPDLYINTEQGF